MYLSQFYFKTAKPFDFYNTIYDRDKMHKKIMEMFDNKRSEEKVLFAVLNPNDNKNKTCCSAPIIIQSENRPNYNNVKNLYQYNCMPIDNTLNKLSHGDIVNLIAVLEPTKRNIARKNGRKIINTEGGRCEWVFKKFSKAGEIKFLKEINKVDASVFRRGVKSRKFSTFTYEITIKINDVDELKKMICTGVGRDKAYGAGLVMIRGLSNGK